MESAGGRGELMGISAVAQALGVSIDTLRRWEKDGRIAFERRGQSRVIAAAEVARLLRERTSEQQSSARNRLDGIVLAVTKDTRRGSDMQPGHRPRRHQVDLGGGRDPSLNTWARRTTPWTSAPGTSGVSALASPHQFAARTRTRAPSVTSPRTTPRKAPGGPGPGPTSTSHGCRPT